MHPADAAVPVGVTEDLERGDGEPRSTSARRVGPERARRHHGRAHGPKDRNGGTLASHQTSPSAQICRSDLALNEAQPLSNTIQLTDRAIEEETGDTRLDVVVRCVYAKKNLSTLAGHRPKFLTLGAQAPGVQCLIPVIGLRITLFRTGGIHTLRRPQKGIKRNGGGISYP